MTLTIQEHLLDEINCVNEVIQKEFEGSSSIFDELVRPMALAGGKRLRAQLCLLIALSGQSNRSQRITIASAIEILHLATLVHDDVLDEAELRRGIDTIHSLYGNKRAILSGDYLFAKAFALIGQAESIPFLQIFCAVIVSLVEGEFLQMEDIGNVLQSIDRYLLKTKQKTADLIEVATRLGAMMAGYNEKEIALFTEYGHNLGMLFQITDDYLDYVAITKESGKPAGKDLLEGLITYPLLSVVTEENVAEIKSALTAVIQGESPESLISYVIAQNGLQHTIALAKKYETKAKTALDELPQFEGKSILYEYVEALMYRHK